MPTGGRKLKTAVITMRVDPRLKAVAEQAAAREHRSLTNWIEVLILGRCKDPNFQTTTPNRPENDT
jgi:predicted HicB family RNase H-like nuclease